jgi:hypothetical protein
VISTRAIFLCVRTRNSLAATRKSLLPEEGSENYLVGYSSRYVSA